MSSSTRAEGGAADLPDWLEPKVRWFSVEQRHDERGSLTPIEFHELPFTPQRIFYVSGAAHDVVRGKHGHRSGMRWLLCLSGKIEVEMRIGELRHVATLRPDGAGLLVQAGVWMQETYASADSVLAVLTDLRFDDEEYFHEP